MTLIYKSHFKKKARIANSITVITGSLASMSAELVDFHLINIFLKNQLALTCLSLATFKNDEDKKA
jgi:hypothetical protein